MPALLESQAVDLLKQVDIHCPPYRVAASVEQAAAACQELGAPLVMKILSPDILHKTDVGGVLIGLQDPPAAAQAYRQMMAEVAEKRPDACLKGVILYPLMADGLEVIVGVTQDVSFGPVLMFGLGGIFVEVLKDVTFRAIPLSYKDARQMIAEIKNIRVLNGWRGKKAVDLDRLARLLCKVSQLICEHPEIKEMDLNPVRILDSGELVVLDAKVILK